MPIKSMPGRQLKTGKRDRRPEKERRNLMKADDPLVQDIISQIIEILREEHRHNQRLLRIVRRKKEVQLREAYNEVEPLLRAEREVVTDLVVLERDRIQLVAELGEVLEHPRPRRLRVAEIVLYANPDYRDELIDIRDELRDIADELDNLGAVEPLFTRHRQDQVRLYVSPERWENLEESGSERLPRRAGRTSATKGHKAS